jgi:hypothetical protein
MSEDIEMVGLGEARRKHDEKLASRVTGCFVLDRNGTQTKVPFRDFKSANVVYGGWIVIEYKTGDGIALDMGSSDKAYREATKINELYIMFAEQEVHVGERRKPLDMNAKYIINEGQKMAYFLNKNAKLFGVPLPEVHFVDTVYENLHVWIREPSGCVVERIYKMINSRDSRMVANTILDWMKQRLDKEEAEHKKHIEVQQAALAKESQAQTEERTQEADALSGALAVTNYDIGSRFGRGN